MKVIVLGANSLGIAAAHYLVEEGNEVTLVDADAGHLESIQYTCDLKTVAGFPSHPHVLKRADAQDMDMLVALTRQDEVNIIACRIAHSLFGVPKKIARIHSRAYLAERKVLFDKGLMPIDAIVSPDHLVARNIQHIIENPCVSQIASFADERVFLSMVVVQNKGILVGQPISKLRELSKDVGVRIVAIYREDSLIIPDADTYIWGGDEVFFVAASADVEKVGISFGHPQTSVRQIVIAGGGRLGFYLAEALERKSYGVKIIEINQDRCNRLSQELDNTIVLRGSVTDENLLWEGGVEHADYFCALCGDQPDNILSSLLAKQFGAGKVISLVQQKSYLDMIRNDHINIDIVLHPQQVSMGELLRYVRQGNLANVHTFRRAKAEAIEVVVHGTTSTSNVVGRKIGLLQMPQGVIIAAIIRRNKVIMPSRDEIIKRKDHVIVFVYDRKHSREVVKLFEASPFYA